MGTFVLFHDRSYALRNSVDVFFRELFPSHAGWGYALFLVIAVSVLAVVFYWLQRRGARPPLRASVLLGAVLEGIGWGIVLALVLHRLTSSSGAGRPGLVDLNLALGAAVYEELLFRVLLIGALKHLLHYGFKLSSPSAWIGAIPLAAVGFAGYHLFLEPFVLSRFLVRFLAGVMLGGLYLKRGYGITVYAHLTADIGSLLGGVF